MTNLDEEYWISFPAFYAHNLAIGTLRMEVGDKATVVCQKTGLRAEIDFQQTGMFSSATLNSISGKVFATSPAQRDIASISGNWDKVVFLAKGEGAKAEPWLDLTTQRVEPKYVLPLSAQGPWESRRLWRYTAQELLQRPEVNWSAVELEKGHLEEEQRLLPCHLKHGAPEYRDWSPKLFKPCQKMDPVLGKERPFHVFCGEKEGVPLNVLALSRELPDPRGGLGMAGADPPIVGACSFLCLRHRLSPLRWHEAPLRAFKPFSLLSLSLSFSHAQTPAPLAPRCLNGCPPVTPFFFCLQRQPAASNSLLGALQSGGPLLLEVPVGVVAAVAVAKTCLRRPSYFASRAKMK